MRKRDCLEENDMRKLRSGHFDVSGFLMFTKLSKGHRIKKE